MSNDSDNNEKRKGAPLPPRGKRRTLKALRADTRHFCWQYYVWRFGGPPDPVLHLLDSRPERDAYEKAQPHEDQARRIYYKLRDAALEAFELEKRIAEKLPNEEDRLWHTGLVVRMAHAIHREDSRPNGFIAEAASRRTWLRNVRTFWQEAGELSEQDIAVLALLGHWWPKTISREHVANEGASVAEVLRAERKNAVQAQKTPKSLQMLPGETPEMWFERFVSGS